MQTKFKLEPKSDTPGVIIDPINNHFEIYGKSLPENAKAFYNPVISFFEEYAKTPNNETVFIFNFEYYNSASVKRIVHIIEILESIEKRGYDVKVIWRYEETDEVMEDNGIEFQETAEILIELQSFKFDY